MAGRSSLTGGDSGGGGGGGGSGFNSVLRSNKRMPSSSSSAADKPLDSFFVSGASHSFIGSRSMVSFEDRGRLFFQPFDQDDNGDDEYDDYFHQPEKKRRLRVDQVQFLEKCFETDNKLEPERKIQLAKDLGLQPRQIAIWFQNRRARWKTKQLEKDYDHLQESYNELKENYENLVKEKEKLKSKVLDLRKKLLLQETEKGTSDSSSSKSPSEPLQQEHNAECVVTESNSPGYVDGFQSLLENGESSYMFEQDQSDESLEVGEDNLEKMFVSGYVMPKIEKDDYPELDAVNSCYPEIPSHDHDQLFGFWALLS